jgi:hypothetical protein
MTNQELPGGLPEPEYYGLLKPLCFQINTSSIKQALKALEMI